MQLDLTTPLLALAAPDIQIDTPVHLTGWFARSWWEAFSSFRCYLLMQNRYWYELLFTGEFIT